jgi:2-oxoglutarate ferredoxin oxidoreductase subunit alpha
MAEFTGLGYYAEIPAVIFDVQRCGPQRSADAHGQQDILSAACSRTATRTSDAPACVGRRVLHDGDGAFDLAEQLQTPSS